MRTRWNTFGWVSTLVFALVMLAGCQSNEQGLLAGAGDGTQARVASGAARKIVVFQQGVVNQAAQDEILQRTGAVKLKALPMINAVVVLASPANDHALKSDTNVLRVENDAIASISGKPAPPPPPAESLPWGIDRIDADLVWDVNHDMSLDAGANAGAGVTVAVVDTGIDLTHPDLKANIVGSYNAISPTSSANDDNGHGTHVAGIIAGIDNSVGVIGVAPNASLLAVKVLNKRGTGYISDIIEGIQWSVANGAKVINMSLGSSSDVQSFHDACAAAYSQGVVIVAAAGNSGPGSNTVEYPAKYAEVIAVSATDSSNTIASFSSRGPEVEIAAPGVSITSCYKGGGYATMSGTSMASPHVAGVAALIIASGVNGPDAVRACLAQTADDLGAAGSDVLYGNGLVDAEQAATGVQTN